MRKHLCQYEQLEDRRVLAAGIVEETGDFVTEIQRWKNLALGRDSNAYEAPSQAELADFEVLASQLLAGNVVTAADLATSLDYELIKFIDATTATTLYELREQLVGGTPTRGWGTYFVNLGFQHDRLVEVPHPLFDTNSWDIGAKSFRDAGVRGFLMAGAHRNANGTGTADVAHLNESIFQTVHQVETDIWIVDERNKRVYRYNGASGLTSGGQNPSSSFALDEDNRKPKGITTNGSSIWVVDDGKTSDQVFKYDLAGNLLGSL